MCPVTDPDEAIGKSGYEMASVEMCDELARARMVLLTTRWNVSFVDALLRGARRALEDWRVTDVREYRVPGALELPLMAESQMREGRCDAIVALGVIIRGDTPHFDFVAGECVRGLREASQRHCVPIGFGVLTVNTPRQAAERAGSGNDNKGYEAVVAALEMFRLLRTRHV